MSETTQRTPSSCSWVTWLPPQPSPVLERLGLCRGPGSDDAPLREDLDVLVSTGLCSVLCLQEEDELERLEPPETLSSYRRQWKERGVEFAHAPIEDFSAPTPSILEYWASWVHTRIERGDRVVVHCQAGLGRAGMMVACVLVRCGMSAKGAISWVRWVRPGSIQSRAQEEAIALFAKRQRCTSDS